MAKYYIGIDPGTETGVAVWDTEKRCFAELFTASLPTALLHIWHDYVGWNNHTVIVFEDARKRKFLPREKDLSEYRGKLMGAGAVKRDCAAWQEFCEAYNFKFEARPPRPGMTKWSPDYFARVTGWTARTSEHARDAALLVFGRK